MTEDARIQGIAAAVADRGLAALTLRELWELRRAVAEEEERGRPREWTAWEADPMAFRREVVSWPTAMIAGYLQGAHYLCEWDQGTVSEDWGGRSAILLEILAAEHSSRMEAEGRPEPRSAFTLSAKTYMPTADRTVAEEELRALLARHGAELRNADAEYESTAIAGSGGLYWCATDKLHVTITCPPHAIWSLAAEVRALGLVRWADGQESAAVSVTVLGANGQPLSSDRSFGPGGAA